MKKILLLAAIILSFCCQRAESKSRTISLANPKLTVYLPSAPDGSGRMVVICPGGGYSHLAVNHEGHDWAHFFNDKGIACAVLEYSMPGGDRSVPIHDVEAAFKIISDSASMWDVDPAKIGIMGSSAGGHLAAISSVSEAVNVNPAFQILFYPVISLDETITHAGTRSNFLGKDPSDELVRNFSSENKVDSSAPPTFIALSADDKAVPPENSLRYFAALQKAGVPVAMFIYPVGGHGWGYRKNFKFHDEMLHELSSWLDTLK